MIVSWGLVRTNNEYFPSSLSFTPLNISVWVMEDVFWCCDHLNLGFVLLLGVGVDPVSVVPSTLSDISPMLLVLNDDDSVIQKIRNSRIYQPQVRGGWIILRVILRVEWRVHSDLFCLIRVELRVHSDMFCLVRVELRVHSNLLCLQYTVTMRVRLSYPVNDVCHLFSACSLYHLFHVPPSPDTYFSCFCALKFNHAPCDVSYLPHDATLLSV